jgi:hypothetical protein
MKLQCGGICEIDMSDTCHFDKFTLNSICNQRQKQQLGQKVEQGFSSHPDEHGPGPAHRLVWPFPVVINVSYDIIAMLWHSPARAMNEYKDLLIMCFSCLPFSIFKCPRIFNTLIICLFYRVTNCYRTQSSTVSSLWDRWIAALVDAGKPCH